MKIFPVDILAGGILLGCLAMGALGTYALRYRGGRGPLILICASVLAGASSVWYLLGAVDTVVVIPWAVYGLWAAGGVLTVLARVWWRRTG